MNEYFFIAEKVKPKTAFAYTDGETPLSHELIPKIKGKTELPFTFTLKNVIGDKLGTGLNDDISEVKHLWLDYQPNNLAWPLMSEKMKNLISFHLTGKEAVVWINAKVKGGDEYREYFIPLFQQKLDVIDEQKTTFVPGTSHIIKPVFSLSKIIKYSLFFAPQQFWEITSGLYISAVIKRAMQKENLTGVGFEKISVI